MFHITVFSTSKDHNCGKDATCGCILVDDGKILSINRAMESEKQTDSTDSSMHPSPAKRSKWKYTLTHWSELVTGTSSVITSTVFTLNNFRMKKNGWKTRWIIFILYSLPFYDSIICTVCNCNIIFYLSIYIYIATASIYYWIDLQ